MRPSIACLFALLACLAVPGAAQSVLVVDGDSFALQAAVDAAAEGDIVLIEPSDTEAWGTVVIDGKSLTLVVDGGRYTLTQLVIRNLVEGQQVTVRGLSVGPGFSFDPFAADAGAVEVRNAAGSVWLDACSIAAAQSSGGFGIAPPGRHGVSVVLGSDVLITDSSLEGAPGVDEFGSCTIPGYVPSSRGGDGLFVRDGRVAVQQSTLNGGEGGGPGAGFCPQGSKSPGGDGLRLAGASSTHVAGSELLGADNPGNAAAPGSGLVLEGMSASVTLRGATVASGSGLPAVPDIVAPAGAVTLLPAPPRGLFVTSPLRQGEPGQIDFDVQAGDLVALWQSPAGAFVPLAGKQGVFLLGVPLVGPVFAAVSPSSPWSLPFGTPPLLPPGVDGATVLLQLLVKSGSQVLVEDVASCTVLDASF